jgi:hypothetical protein
MAETRNFGSVVDGHTAWGECQIGDVAMWAETSSDRSGVPISNIKFAVCVPHVYNNVINQTWEYDTNLSFFVEAFDLTDDDESRSFLEQELKKWEFSISYSGKVLCHERPAVLEELKANVAFLGIF